MALVQDSIKSKALGLANGDDTWKWILLIVAGLALYYFLVYKKGGKE